MRNNFSINFDAIVNASGSITIGIKDGTIDTTSPVIRGKINGVNNSSTFNFYDGVLYGVSNAIVGNIKDKEDGSSLANSTELIDNYTYQKFILN